MELEQTSSVLAIGEKVHIVERRKFETDLRRHFIGEVVYCSDHHIKASGFPYVYSPSSKIFEKVDPDRVRIFANDNHIAVTLLPPNFDLRNAVYKRIPYKFLLCDADGFEMELDDFGTHG